jgi:hypothetical protein
MVRIPLGIRTSVCGTRRADRSSRNMVLPPSWAEERLEGDEPIGVDRIGKLHRVRVRERLAASSKRTPCLASLAAAFSSSHWKSP